jgi:hypothetical protein
VSSDSPHTSLLQVLRTIITVAPTSNTTPAGPLAPIKEGVVRVVDVTKVDIETVSSSEDTAKQLQTLQVLSIEPAGSLAFRSDKSKPDEGDYGGGLESQDEPRPETVREAVVSEGTTLESVDTAVGDDSQLTSPTTPPIRSEEVDLNNNSEAAQSDFVRHPEVRQIISREKPEQNRSAAELEALILGVFRTIEGFPEHGIAITAYGYGPDWNAMLTFAPGSTTLAQAKDYRRVLPEVVQHLRTKFALK